MRSSRTFTVRPSGPTSRLWSTRARPTPAAPEPALVGRFAADLDALIPPGERLGLAVSGGPDSLALLILASRARPGLVEAASVDHALRQGSEEEALFVAALCGTLGVPHSTLRIDWAARPATAIQEKARAKRYAILGRWIDERGLGSLATAHHLDDQVETLVMRLNRGAGVRGLAGMRAIAPLPGSTHRLVRPLLSWRRSELEAVCNAAGVVPVEDPSNSDERFERVRVRKALAKAGWIDPTAVARSADCLASADSSLDWAAELEWERQVEHSGSAIDYAPSAPSEIRRRIVARAVESLASEGEGRPLRGRELDPLIESLAAGGTATLRGVRCSGGDYSWRFEPAPKRRS